MLLLARLGYNADPDAVLDRCRSAKVQSTGCNCCNMPTHTHILQEHTCFCRHVTRRYGRRRRCPLLQAISCCGESRFLEPVVLEVETLCQIFRSKSASTEEVFPSSLNLNSMVMLPATEDIVCQLAVRGSAEAVALVSVKPEQSTC